MAISFPRRPRYAEGDKGLNLNKHTLNMNLITLFRKIYSGADTPALNQELAKLNVSFFLIFVFFF